MISKRTIILVLILTSSLRLLSSNAELSQISSVQGLSNSSVICIYQDSSQVMWFGTWDGLNSFNGRSYKTYKYEPNNPNSITNNIIRSIVGQNGRKLWIATDRGVSRIDTKTNKIDRFYLGYENIAPGKESSFKIAQGGKNTMFCAVYEWSLSYYNENKNEFTALNIPLIKKFDIVEMHGDAAGNLWLLSEKGEIYCVIPQIHDDGTVSIESCTQLSEGLQFEAIFSKSGNDFWLIDSEYNLYTLNTSSNHLTKIAHLKNGDGKGKITAITGNNANLFIAYSLAGLFNFSMERNALIPIKEIEKQGVLSLFWSSQKILWVGTDGNGLILMSERNVKFNTILNKDINKFRRSPVRAFCEDIQHNIWIGSKGNGLCVASGMSQPKPQIKEIAGLDNNSVYCIINGLNNDLFVGTDGTGISVCTPQNIKKIDLSILTTNGDNFSQVYSMYLDRKTQTLWVGTSGYGLIKLRIQYFRGTYKATDYKIYSFNKSIEGSLSNNTVYSIVPENDEKLWIATRGGGLNLFDISKEKFHPYQKDGNDSISDNDVLCITKSADGTIWAGTSYGLNKISYNSNGSTKIKHYTEYTGLPNNTIHGIIEDSSKTLWVSTNKGITKFNPDNGQMINFNNGYELQSNEFSDGAYFKSGSGEVYFGGINGFNYFVPTKINERTYSPLIIFSDFTVRNQNILDRISKQANQSTIKLNYNENFFSVSFVALDYINNSNCEYAYILEGFNKEWTTITTNNTAVFTNVPSGTYTFRVKSTNGDKLWSDNEKTISIVIASPWWATWWAYLIYASAIGLVGYLIYLVLKKRISLNRAIFLERIEKKQQQQVHEAKLRFFTNIAHEFSTPLTLIYGPCEKLLDHVSSDDFSKKYIHIIKSNAERMQGLITELMDFRKAETGHRELSFETVDIYELAKYVADNFSEFAEEKKISFAINISTSEHQWITDRDCFEKILFNLVSNAFKYTNEEGYINVNIDKEQGTLKMSIVNSGQGIKAEDIGQVFNRFKILDNFEKKTSKGFIQRTGIGLALAKSLVILLNGDIKVSSVVGEYVDFSITLPQLNATMPKREQTIPDIPDALLKKVNDIYTEETERLPLILVIDDEAEIRELVKDVLCEQYRIIEAHDGHDALEIMKYKRPALIISDIIMPNMDGVKLLAELKNNRYTNHIPVIFLSSKTTIEDQISGYQRGLETYLTKPFNPKHLVAVVNQIFENRKSLKDYYASSLSSLEEYNGHQMLTDDKEFLLKIANIIEVNIENEHLNPDFIIREMALSRMQLYRKMKELCDSSPSEFIRRIKLQHASKLLKSTNLTVQEIMYQSGFNNKSYFYREFQKENGIPPKEYRN